MKNLFAFCVALNTRRREAHEAAAAGRHALEAVEGEGAAAATPG